ncbi:hypothetical protein PPSIR1_35202 [Plesiocystis pacifica SIR-1]|uniref:ADYC domain-containing protein n=1 Tax=Plesiocystis pacifica SIR-1 TaxID=391625 RepID=A6G3U8_9BACT|nr:ADYC domain-containing protein [Plesiocystis pacifica]EDM79485.1 hypothetical protein PPSIR1_35202 [Plesiocystis pacifica SIR-1]
MRTPATIATLALSLLTFAACDSGTETETEDSLRSVYVYNKTLNFGQCPTHLCGTNASIGGSISVNIDGKASNADERLVEVIGPDDAEIDLELAGNLLWAIDAQGDTLLGHDLVGTEMVFENDFSQERTSVYLTEYWPEGVESKLVPGMFYPTYEFEFRKHDEPEEVRHDLCTSNTWTEDADPSELPSNDAIIIQAEAYDWFGFPVENIDADGEAESWGTIGCAGGAFAKKVLMGYDVNNPAPQDVTRADNDAMMHMLTARYCGEDTHTEMGTPMYWQNQKNWFQPPEDLEIEAIWGEDGALCLNVPRHAEREEIIALCGEIPTCDDFEPSEHALVSFHAEDPE